MIKIGVATLLDIRLPLLQADFEEMQADPLPPKKSKKKAWALLFDPDLLVEDHGELTSAAF